MTATLPESRSSLQLENLQEHLDASVSAGHATLNFGQQYETPPALCEFLARLLPSRYPVASFDPQCASGNPLNGISAYFTKKFGFEIDNRFKDRSDSISRVIGNCVKAWEALDDLYPDATFECQVANPPFGLRWKLPNGATADSTEYTWRKIMERAPAGGYGWFMSNWKTIERLGIHQHERVYLYQKFPAGLWKNCDVEVGVVHWFASACRPGAIHLQYTTLDFTEHASALQPIKDFFHESKSRCTEATPASELASIWSQLQQVLNEESRQRSEWNVWLDDSGKLRTYLSTRATVKRKLQREEILRVSRVNGAHPLTLTTDRETRLLLAHLIGCGFYTIEPRAKSAIESALAEVASVASPIMPATDFEAVAYADEQDHLLCVAAPKGFAFTPGRKYEISTATYAFTENFKRKKVHLCEESGQTYTREHACTLSGQDRYVQVRDDAGVFHRFLDRPDKDRDTDHQESVLWKIFQKPVVNTVADLHPEVVARNLRILKQCEMLAGFTYYPGQLEYLGRVSVKDYGLAAGSTGSGKSLMCLSLIQMKAPQRALIIAPQGTIRASEDDDEGEDFKASQWVTEIRRFAPGLPVFELFSHADYLRILKANKGALPLGIYITYFQAMFLNGARETCPESWTDGRLAKQYGMTLPDAPEDVEDPERHWCRTIGEERDGIRCIAEPCLATLIGHHFDMVCVDEAHICANLNASVTQMLIRLQPRYRFAFTATPIPNVISNLFSLMGWLCVPEWHKGERRNAAWPFARGDLARFDATFRAEERDHTQESINRDANPDYKGKCVKTSPVISSPARLLKLLKPTMAYISKEICNPALVPCQVTDVRVPMGAEQSRLYAHFLNRANIPCKNPLIRARKQISYLRAICADPAGFTHGGPPVRSNFNPKTTAILELVRDILSRGEQAVIVSARVGQSSTLHRLLLDAGVTVSRIDSTTTGRHSFESNQFKAGKSQVILMGIRCAMGYSFPRCPNLIIGSLEYSPGPYNQAAGRVWRVDSLFPVTIYCVLHKGSIEETMFDTVATKDDAATICLKGRRAPRDFKPVDMSEVLAHSMKMFQTGGVNELACEEQWPKLCQILRQSAAIPPRPVGRVT